jgi:hypothetical protein
MPWDAWDWEGFAMMIQDGGATARALAPEKKSRLKFFLSPTRRRRQRIKFKSFLLQARQAQLLRRKN